MADVAAASERLRQSLVTASTDDLRALVTSEILGQAPLSFDESPADYDAVREHLAARLSTSAELIHLVGSGSLGYSTAVGRFPREFRIESDLDFAVISPELFDTAWNTLLGWGHVHKPLFPPSDAKWFEQRQREIFWGWFKSEKPRFPGINRPELVREFDRVRLLLFDTFQGVGKAFPRAPVAFHSVNARLYRSEEHLVQYHTEGLRRLRARLLESAGET